MVAPVTQPPDSGGFVTRRAFFATLIGVPIIGTTVPALGMRAGVHLTGRLDATEAEHQEMYANFGKACALIVNDKALWDAIKPMLGTTVTLSLVQP